MKRIEYIDLTKIIAILLIVSSHTNVLPSGFNILINSFYIVVFFVCTGLTFNEDKLTSFKKLFDSIKKLLKYYIFYSLILLLSFTLLTILQNNFDINVLFDNIIGIFYGRYTYSADSNIVLMGAGNAPMWYIFCYILSYSLYFCLRKIKINSYLSIAVLLITGFMFSLFKVLLPWSLDIVPFTTIFIFIGDLLKKYKILDKINIVYFIICLLIMVIMNHFNTNINLSLKIYGLNYFYTFILGFIGSITLIKLCQYLCNITIFKLFSIYGKYTLNIMCYHLMIIYILRIIINNPIILIITTIIAVILSSRIISNIVSKMLRV